MSNHNHLGPPVPSAWLTFKLMVQDCSHSWNGRNDNARCIQWPQPVQSLKPVPFWGGGCGDKVDRSWCETIQEASRNCEASIIRTGKEWVPNVYVPGNRPRIKRSSGYWLSSRADWGIKSFKMLSTPPSTIRVLSSPRLLLLNSRKLTISSSSSWVKLSPLFDVIQLLTCYTEWSIQKDQSLWYQDCPYHWWCLVMWCWEGCEHQSDIRWRRCISICWVHCQGHIHGGKGRLHQAACMAQELGMGPSHVTSQFWVLSKHSFIFYLSHMCTIVTLGVENGVLYTIFSGFRAMIWAFWIVWTLFCTNIVMFHLFWLQLILKTTS